MSDSLAIFLDRAKFYAQDAVVTISQCLCKPDATLKINGRSYRIERLLGEGGFSFVYLIQDLESQRLFALKKILISSSSSSSQQPSASGESDPVKQAMKEVEAYRRFKHPNIIRCLDCAVVQGEEGVGGKIIYLFLPYYKRGNLQDVINSHAINGERMSERGMLSLFRGTCAAVQAMHRYRLPSVPLSQNASGSNSSTSSAYPPKPTLSTQPSTADSDSFPLTPDLTGGPASSSSHVPLMRRSEFDETLGLTNDDDEGGDEGHADREVMFDGDEEMGEIPGAGGKSGKRSDKGKAKAKGMQGSTGAGEEVPYSHRDIKPGNVMIADDGSPILMDFGSTRKARIMIETRQQALLEQDIAAEHSTMPYRAPELFDVKTGVMLDEKVDIWSLGCTLFALAYNYSPFEDPAQGGGSIAMQVSSGRYRHPSSSTYSKAFRLLIDSMMVVDPAQRPDIDKVIELTDGVMRTLSG